MIELPHHLPDAARLYELRLLPRRVRRKDLAEEGLGDFVKKLVPGPLGIALDIVTTLPAAIAIPKTAINWISLVRRPAPKVVFPLRYKVVDAFNPRQTNNTKVERWRKQTKRKYIKRITKRVDRDAFTLNTMRFVYPGAALGRVAVGNFKDVPTIHKLINELPTWKLPFDLPILGNHISLAEIFNQPISHLLIETGSILAAAEFSAWLNKRFARAVTNRLVLKYNQIDDVADAQLNAASTSPAARAARAVRSLRPRLPI